MPLHLHACICKKTYAKQTQIEEVLPTPLKKMGEWCKLNGYDGGRLFCVL